MVAPNTLGCAGLSSLPDYVIPTSSCFERENLLLVFLKFKHFCSDVNSLAAGELPWFAVMGMTQEMGLKGRSSLMDDVWSARLL